MVGPSRSGQVSVLPAFFIIGFVVFFCGSCAGVVSSSHLPPQPPGSATLELVPVASGFSTPLDVQQPDDNSGRLFVVEQGGHIQIIQSGGTRAAAPFLDVTGRAGFTSGGETGLLGLAFHPNYQSNHHFYVNYTRNNGTQLQTVIAEFTASAANANFADPTTENILFTVDQPTQVHKGGALAFGKDGLLYIGLGDGGGEGDPSGNGQNTDTLLGKMLRIDVDSAHSPGLNYAIPPGNPFATSGGRAEIWLYGLRKEIDHLTSTQGGANLGWNTMEGLHCFNPSTGCSMAGLTMPVFEYEHTQGDKAVIGGHVYHGTKIPSLDGAYVFGDFISGRIWVLTQGGSTLTRTSLLDTAANDLSSIGRDQLGELYVARYSSGVVSRLHQVGQP